MALGVLSRQVHGVVPAWTGKFGRECWAREHLLANSAEERKTRLDRVSCGSNGRSAAWVADAAAYRVACAAADESQDLPLRKLLARSCAQASGRAGAGCRRGRLQCDAVLARV